MINIGLTLKKKAEKSEPGWWAKQFGMDRALQKDDNTSLMGLPDTELLKAQFRKGLHHSAIGALGGAAAGAGVGTLRKKYPGSAATFGGAAIGGALGYMGGYIHGEQKVMKEYLKQKGIDFDWGGLKLKFSPQARKKYIEDQW